MHSLVVEDGRLSMSITLCSTRESQEYSLDYKLCLHLAERESYATTIAMLFLTLGSPLVPFYIGSTGIDEREL